MNASKHTPAPPRRPVLTLRGPEPEPAKPATHPPDVTRYWFVWQPDRCRPKKRHATLDAALAEAERLAALNPSIEFFVYEAQLVERRVLL